MTQNQTQTQTETQTQSPSPNPSPNPNPSANPNPNPNPNPTRILTKVEAGLQPSDPWHKRYTAEEFRLIRRAPSTMLSKLKDVEEAGARARQAATGRR